MGVKKKLVEMRYQKYSYDIRLKKEQHNTYQVHGNTHEGVEDYHRTYVAEAAVVDIHSSSRSGACRQYHCCALGKSPLEAKVALAR